MRQAVHVTDQLPAPSSRAARPLRRERGPVGELARLFLSQLLAVLAVATIIAAVFAVVGADRRTPDEAAAPGGAASSGAQTPSPEPSTAAGSTPPASPSPSVTATLRPPKIDVLNQSAGSGAAATVAAGLEERGWRIGRVDDFVGTVRTTTIYFPPGRRADARRLAQDFAQRPRILPVFAGLAERRLTVILVG